MTLVASVAGVGKGALVPTGSVSFYDGETFLETVALKNGKAQLLTSSLSPGTHFIRMTYLGTAAFAASSASLRLTVKLSKASIARARVTKILD